MKSTKEKLIHSAVNIMVVKGYNATTISEICEQADISKGGFFHYFKNKEDVTLQAIDTFFQLLMKAMSISNLSHIKSPYERLMTFMQALIENTEKGLLPEACLLGNLSQELGMQNQKIASKINNYFCKITDDFTVLMDEVAKEKNVKIEADQIANHFLSIIQGSLVLYRVSKEKSIIIGIFTQFTDHLQKIFNN